MTDTTPELTPERLRELLFPRLEAAKAASYGMIGLSTLEAEALLDAVEERDRLLVAARAFVDGLVCWGDTLDHICLDPDCAVCPPRRALVRALVEAVEQASTEPVPKP